MMQNACLMRMQSIFAGHRFVAENIVLNADQDVQVTGGKSVTVIAGFADSAFAESLI
jgi:hypothetical protein